MSDEQITTDSGHSLKASEWQALEELRSGRSAVDAAGRLGVDETSFRQLLATAAEKLRIASLPPTPEPTGAVSFQVPHRSPCPFCENFAGRYPWHGPPAVIGEDGLTYAYLAPAAMGGMPGHTLVLSRRHVETIFDLTAEEEAALGRAVAAAARAVRSAFDPPGVLIQQHNGVAAFQTVPHLHFHVIPKVPGPFPHPAAHERIPYEQRTQLAGILRGHWPSTLA